MQFVMSVTTRLVDVCNPLRLNSNPNISLVKQYFLYLKYKLYKFDFNDVIINIFVVY